MGDPKLAPPPQMVADWIALAVRYVEAGGIGCPLCRGGAPSAATARSHDRHPKDCKGALERIFAARDVQTFLLQPAECWYGLASAPPDLSFLAEGDT
jgi:hypothetical protein